MKRAVHRLDSTLLRAALAGALCAGVAGCPGAAAPDRPPPPPPDSPADAPPGSPTPSGLFAVGTAIEVLQAGRYTYVLIDAGPDGRAWVAAPQLEVPLGARVGAPPGAQQQGFRSAQLGRTFGQVTFVPRVELLEVPVVVPLAELGARRTELAGRTVAVEGRVARYVEATLGRNWIHVEDEAGSRVVASTQAVVEPGRGVVVRGVLALDRELGPGLRYAELIEDAAVHYLPARGAASLRPALPPGHPGGAELPDGSD